MSDEPVAYLGGDQGGKKPADDDEVDGYLGGQAEEEELPSLPPQESHESYSAKDFLDNEVQEAPVEEDPYADPYAQPAAAEGYGDYEGYDASAQQGDAAYFDSMAHGGAATDEAAPPAEEYASEEYGGDDPDQPKTISQQDAESIIRRITTKRILPPETSEKKVAVTPAPKLTEAGGGLRIWPILFVILIVGAMGLFFFGEELAKQFPELRPLLFWLPPEEKPPEIEVVDRVDPNVVAKKKLLDMVLLSEAKAFGVAVKDVPAAAVAPAAGAGGKPATTSEPAAPTTTAPGGG